MVVILETLFILTAIEKSYNRCLCGGDVHPIQYRDQFSKNCLLVCEECGMIRIDAVPSQTQLCDFYQYSYSKNRCYYVNDSYMKIMRRRAEAQCKFISKHIQLERASIIDFGCGYGRLLDVLRQRGATTYASDYDPFCIDLAKSRGHKIIAPDILNNQYSQKRWDLVCLSHVLEHLQNPKDFLCRLRNCSTFVFVEVPKYERSCHEQFIDQEGHLWFFNEKGLRGLISAAGFNIVSMITVGPPLRFFWSNSPLIKLIISFLRSAARDYFFNMYNVHNPYGMWIRLIARIRKL